MSRGADRADEISSVIGTDRDQWEALDRERWDGGCRCVMCVSLFGGAVAKRLFYKCRCVQYETILIYTSL